MTEIQSSQSLRERAELYYCLSRAFVTPAGPQALPALAEALPEDLRALAESLDYAFAEPLAAYCDSVARIGDADALLALYSSLFLAPPREIRINVATYIDGALNGGTVVAMEDLYRRCGVERDDEFHDLSDHVSVQLEFVAYLYFKQAEASDQGVAYALPATAGEFLHDFVRRWLPRFLADIEAWTTKRGLANPYLWLTRMLSVAVSADAEAVPVDAREARAARAIAKARGAWGNRDIGPEDLEIIARKLREKGLSTEHLAIPPERRDDAQGLSRKVPPDPRRGSRIG